MQGLVLCSSESGILLCAQTYEPYTSFGVNTNVSGDSMQFASTLFALYSSGIRKECNLTGEEELNTKFCNLEPCQIVQVVCFRNCIQVFERS